MWHTKIHLLNVNVVAEFPKTSGNPIHKEADVLLRKGLPLPSWVWHWQWSHQILRCSEHLLQTFSQMHIMSLCFVLTRPCVIPWKTPLVCNALKRFSRSSLVLLKLDAYKKYRSSPKDMLREITFRPFKGMLISAPMAQPIKKPSGLGLGFFGAHLGNRHDLRWILTLLMPRTLVVAYYLVDGSEILRQNTTF